MADRPAPTSAGTTRTPSRARNAGRPGCRELAASLRFPPPESRGPPRLIQCQRVILGQPTCSAFPKGHSRLLLGSSPRLPDGCQEGCRRAGSCSTDASAPVPGLNRRPLRPELAAPPGVWPSSQLACLVSQNRNVLARARSAGISVRASHRPLTCRNRSSCGRMPGSSSSMGMPDGNVMRTSVGPAAARTSHQLGLAAHVRCTYEVFWVPRSVILQQPGEAPESAVGAVSQGRRLAGNHFR
jgi:hypothetical protein